MSTNNILRLYFVGSQHTLNQLVLHFHFLLNNGLLQNDCKHRVHQMFCSPPVPRFASAGPPEWSAALPHLHSHFRCLMNTPLSHCGPADDWGTHRCVTVETVTACNGSCASYHNTFSSPGPAQSLSDLWMSAISARSLSISSFSVAISLRNTCSSEISSSCSVRISFSWLWRHKTVPSQVVTHGGLRLVVQTRSLFTCVCVRLNDSPVPRGGWWLPLHSLSFPLLKRLPLRGLRSPGLF